MTAKRRKRFRKGTLFLASFFLAASIPKDTVQAAWMQNAKGYWWQQEDGSFPAGTWKTINGKTYYFDHNGYLCTGWREIDHQWYYLGDKNDGARKTGWIKVNNLWYYCNSNGVMQTGWVQSNGHWYYLDSHGVMQTGWKQINNKWYYLNPNGIMQTGWKQLGAKWYYLDSNGVMQTGWKQIGSKWYYLDSNGVMQTGWLNDAQVWTSVGLDGSLDIGTSSCWYYLNSGGVMQTGWKQLGKDWYYLDTNGVMQTGWRQLNKKWYYFYSNGKMARSTKIGSQSIDANGVWTSGSTGNPPGTYTKESVYGPRLQEKQLGEVASAVTVFLQKTDLSGKTELEKALLALNYLSDQCSYAADYNKNGANTAWGALVYHEAQCSGYARAYKALCDAMGIGCYYVHANSGSFNPSHQWTEIRIDGHWYIVDPQLYDSSGFGFLLSESEYTNTFGMTWDHTGLPSCSTPFWKDYTT